MKRYARRTLLALLLIIIYMLWHPDPTRKELQVDALWALHLPRAVAAAAAADDAATATGSDAAGAQRADSDGSGAPRADSDGVTTGSGSTGLLPVSTDDVFAYLDGRGHVAHHGRVAHRVALSRSGFINHGRTPGQLIVQAPDGSFRASIPIAGYPVFERDRIFVVSAAGGTLSEWTMDGERRWQMDLPAPLVALSAGSDRVGLGMLAGDPLLLDGTGALVELQRAAVARNPLALDVDLSDRVPRFATMTSAGRDQNIERSGAALVTLYDLSGDVAVPIVRRTIERSTAAPPVVRLLDGGEVLLYSAVGRQSETQPAPSGHMAVALEVESGADSVIPLDYPLREVEELDSPVFRVALSVSPQRDPSRGFARPAALVLFSRGAAVPLRSRWAADLSDLAVWDGVIVLRLDDRILAWTPGVR